MIRWYRAYEGTVSDAKLHEAALVADVSRSVAVAAWHAILEAAASAQDGGRYETTPRRVAAILCEPPASIERLFAAFEDIGLVGNGYALSWKRRQYESDTSTERVRKHRQRKCNADETLQAVSATPPETETETEVTDAIASDASSAASPDPSIAERELFARGKALLGAKAGGVISNLLKAKGRNVALARAVVEEASAKADPMAWVQGAIRSGPRPAARGDPPPSPIADFVRRTEERIHARERSHDPSSFHDSPPGPPGAPDARTGRAVAPSPRADWRDGAVDLQPIRADARTA